MFSLSFWKGIFFDFSSAIGLGFISHTIHKYSLNSMPEVHAALIGAAATAFPYGVIEYK